jgi:hypothetical protein
VLPEQAADAKKLQRRLGMAPGTAQPLPATLVDGAPKVRTPVRNDVVPGPALKGPRHNPSNDQRRTRKPTAGPAGRQGPRRGKPRAR